MTSDDKRRGDAGFHKAKKTNELKELKRSAGLRPRRWRNSEAGGVSKKGSNVDDTTLIAALDLRTSLDDRQPVELSWRSVCRVRYGSEEL